MTSQKDEAENKNNEMTTQRNQLAKKRTQLAENRTFQAAERTYSAWIRTGFSISTAGLTIGKILHDSAEGNIALLIGGMLIFIGMSTFVYAWIGYKNVYDDLRKDSMIREGEARPFKTNIVGVSILTVALLVVAMLGLWLMFL
ncbi:YidH family protein [Lacticigenium naphthae]|uniref:YidH family protein n=1 Tax=Lacticigenium naphthae TaxID=515351 RepID=UPI00040CB647|nr:DUF202 domain-containing protein [Lacticigenium naphthae]